LWLFHKEKNHADGSFDKDKCRIVTLFQLHDEDSICETQSPTVNPISVMTQLKLTANNPASRLSAYDIKSAFLLTPLKKGIRMFICISPDVVKFWIKRYPARSSYVEKNGNLYFELFRYLYGLH
jgi:hypothetical protein